MGRSPSPSLTEREAEIMNVLWKLGEATAEGVRERLGGRPHDSTVRTMLRVLERKGFVRHESLGKAYVYRASLPRRTARVRALQAILSRFFGGSAKDLVLHLIEDEKITRAQLDELERSVDGSKPSARRGRARREKRGKP